MADRLCGYCRGEGHRKTVCPQLLNERNTVLTHTPMQRKKLIELFGKVGLGIGALLRVQDYWDRDKFFLCIVKDFDWVAECNFIEAKNLKYSKKVRIQTRDARNDYITRAIHTSVLKLDGNAENYRISVPIGRLVGRLENDTTLMAEEQYYSRLLFTIDAPSHEIDYDPEILVKNVDMPRRLLQIGRAHV